MGQISLSGPMGGRQTSSCQGSFCGRLIPARQHQCRAWVCLAGMCSCPPVHSLQKPGMSVSHLWSCACWSILHIQLFKA